MKDGRGNRVNPKGFTNEDRADFVDSFLVDERASDEWHEAVKHLMNIIDGDNDENAWDAEEVFLNLEAVIAYETGVFTGNDYFAETYWDNYKKFSTERSD